MQVRNSVETSLEKARRIKKEKAEARKKAQEQQDPENSYIMEVDELDQEIETIINKNNNGK